MPQRPNHQSTVAIPLHASAPWIDRVEDNIRALREVAHVLVSDVSAHDDTLDRLRDRLGEHPSVSWNTSGTRESGWVAHCNLLLGKASTKYFMWLAHDDTVEPAWVLQGERALRRQHKAVLAVGRLLGLREEGEPFCLEPVADYSSKDATARIASSLSLLFTSRHDGLGHSFRGLMRRALAPAIPQIDDGGTKADMYWALTLLGRGPFVSIDATYTKTWHSRSASAGWQPITESPSFRSNLRDALREFAPEIRETLFLNAWTEEALTLRDRNLELSRRLAELVAPSRAGYSEDGQPPAVS